MSPTKVYKPSLNTVVHVASFCTAVEYIWWPLISFLLHHFISCSSNMGMPTVDMPILEAPGPSQTSLDQQDEDFLRELTDFEYNQNNQDKQPLQNYGNYNSKYSRGSITEHIEWGSEYRTSLVFKWSKKVECQIGLVFWMPFKYRTNGHHLVFLCTALVFKWSV